VTNPALLVVTGDHLLRLTGGEDGWTGETLLEGTAAQCVATGAEGTIWLGTRGHGVLASDDAGATWRNAGLPAPDVFSVAVSPADGAVYAGTEPSMIFRRDGHGDGEWTELDALRRIPSAPRWSYPPRPWTSHVRWIAPSPHDADLLLAGIELGGVMRSADGGRSWRDHPPGAVRDVHCLAWHPEAPGRAYESGGSGASWSTDAGTTWTAADDGRDRHYAWALAVDPRDSDRWFVSASPGPYKAHGEGSAEALIYRRTADGPWEPLAGGLPTPLDAMPYAMTFTGDLLVAGLSDGRLLASPDRGERWKPMTVGGRAPEHVLALSVT
jgi:photosystem II stability/assembly factor-like uncharacterized protein